MIFRERIPPIKNGPSKPFFNLKLYDNIINTRKIEIMVEVKVNNEAKNIPSPKKSIANKVVVDSFIFPDARGLVGLPILSFCISKRSLVIIPPI